MSSIRTTNVLLTVIAACLIALCAKDRLPDVIPSAHAQSNPSRVLAMGCSMESGTCLPVALKVNAYGVLLTK